MSLLGQLAKESWGYREELPMDHPLAVKINRGKDVPVYIQPCPMMVGEECIGYGLGTFSRFVPVPRSADRQAMCTPDRRGSLTLEYIEQTPFRLEEWDSQKTVAIARLIAQITGSRD